MGSQSSKPASVLTLGRVIVVLSMTFLGLLSVVVLRAEVTRLHYALAQLEREQRVARQALQERELQWSRLRSPLRIQEEARKLQEQAETARRG